MICPLLLFPMSLIIVCQLTYNYLVIKFGTFRAFIHLVNCLFSFDIIGFSFLYYFIVCFYCKTRFKSFNNYLQSLLDAKCRVFLKFKVIDQLIEDHNSICLNIELKTSFGRNTIFALTYILIAVNLLVLQLLLFEKLMPLF
jgi:hypothetical protein